ncbi:MAG TPA: replicative DNA helicase [Planctomycetota bacterium]|nr:replicative DNA helicase [Planctomycetota bacterium]
MVDFVQPQERGVPRNIDAERSVLGALMLHADALGDVSMVLRPEDFYVPAHQVIYRSICEVHDERAVADPIAVEEHLARKSLLAEAGGREALMDLVASIVSPASVLYHAEIVREKAIARRLLEACLEISRQAYENSMDPRELLEDAERRIFAIAREGQASEAKSIDQILAETFDRIDHLREREGRLTGLPTHYYDLDDMTGGLHAGELLILAARPSMGKTSFALNVLERVARDGNGVVFFSLEMSAQQVIQNMLCCRAQIHGLALRKGRITNEQYQRLHQEAEALYEAPIFVDDSPGLSIVQARAKCRRLKQRHPEKVKLIVIDYLQLMTAGQRVESRQQEIATISRGLKAIARELEVPVIALSQLNRDVENRDDHRPRMSDLRESGAIEQDADVIMLLHRDEYYKRTEENAGLAQIIIAKQRNGPTGEVQLRFFPEYMRFENYQRRAEPIA